MKLWSRGSKPVDQGEKVNERARELQGVATKGLTESEAVIALGNALAYAAAALVVRHPGMSVDETLDLVWQGVRDQAYVAAPVSSQPDNAKELTPEEFNALASRIVTTAATMHCLVTQSLQPPKL